MGRNAHPEEGGGRSTPAAQSLEGSRGGHDGRRGREASRAVKVPQGGVISPLLSNIYLTEVDAMLERAKEVTRERLALQQEAERRLQSSQPGSRKGVP